MLSKAREENPVWNRRGWLVSVAAGLVLLGRSDGLCAWQDGGRSGRRVGPALPELDRSGLESRLQGLGIDGIRVEESERYQAVGNAAADFMGKAVSLLEALAKDYTRHMTAKGFELSEPDGKLLLSPLGSATDFAKVLGFDPGPMVGGVYELDTNLLLLFDNRDVSQPNPAAERANSVALYHEATHQLTFNTGLLNREGDVPLAISEGLAMYGEVRRPDGRTPIGRVNIDRLGVIRNSERDGLEWLSVERLFEDGTFDDDATVQMAYAQSWLLIHGLMQQKKTVERFLAYLDGIRTRTDRSKRLDDVVAHLGDLDKLNQDMKNYAIRLIRG